MNYRQADRGRKHQPRSAGDGTRQGDRRDEKVAKDVFIGDGTFGNQYGWYVDAITRRISQNWLKSLVDTNVRSAPRVYMSFDIARNGAVSNIEVKQPSGIPSLDRSAMRALYAAATSPSR